MPSIPIRTEGRHMLVAMANPTDYRAMQEVEFKIGRTLKVLVCTRTEILDAIAKFYEPEDSLKAFTDNGVVKSQGANKAKYVDLSFLKN